MQNIQLFLQHRIDQINPHHGARIRIGYVVHAPRKWTKDVKCMIAQLNTDTKQKENSQPKYIIISDLKQYKTTVS